MSRGKKYEIAKQLQKDTHYNVNNKTLEEFAVHTLEDMTYETVKKLFTIYKKQCKQNFKHVKYVNTTKMLKDSPT